MDRKLLPFDLKFAGDAKDGTFEGYGAVFGNVDSYGDVIVPGAFKKTLAAWKKQKRLPQMLLQHGGWGSSVDDFLPIGLWTDMREDEKGLWCEGVFADTTRGQDVRKLCRMEPRPALDGLSIGYYAKTVVYGTKPEEPRRTLKEIDLEEVSVVTFPANDQALIAAVKSARDLTIREFETALERGTLPALTSSDAKKLLSGGFKALTAARDAGDDEAAQLASRFRALRA
jgi:HK97 family phage prohead protease